MQRQIAAAEDRALQTAMLSKEVGPSITDAAVHARYDQDIAGKPGEEEVHAKHILVDSEAQAKKIIAELKGGADFAALAKQYSKDPSGAQQGGDLGFFKKDEMVPEFADAAFAMQPGQVSPTPVHTPVRLACHPGGGAPPGRAADLRAGARRTAPEDDPGRCAEGGGAGARRRRRSRSSTSTARRSRATDTAEPPPRTRQSITAAKSEENVHGHRLSRRLPFRCRNCRRSPASAWAPPRPASATRDAPTW